MDRHIHRTYDNAVKHCDMDGDDLLSRDELQELLRYPHDEVAFRPSFVSIPSFRYFIVLSVRLLCSLRICRKLALGEISPADVFSVPKLVIL